MSRLLKLVLFTVMGLLILMYLYYGENDLLPNLGDELDLYIFTFISSQVVGWGVLMINQRLNKKLPWRRNILLRFLAGQVVDFAWVIGVLVLLT